MSRGGRNYQRTGTEPGPGVSTAASVDAWYRRMKGKPRIHGVVLVYEGLSGVEEVEQWQLPELDEGAGETIFAAAQCHAEDLGAVGRYVIRLVAEDGQAVGSKLIRVAPTDAAGELPIGTTSVEDPSVHGVVAQVLRHNEALIRMYVGSMGGVLGRMHDLLKMEQNENDILRRRNRQLQNDAEVDGEDDEAAAERSAALGKLAEAVTEHIIPAMARRYGNGGQHDA